MNDELGGILTFKLKVTAFATATVTAAVTAISNINKAETATVIMLLTNAIKRDALQLHVSWVCAVRRLFGDSFLRRNSDVLKLRPACCTWE